MPPHEPMMMPLIRDTTSNIAAVLDSQRVEKFRAVVERGCFVIWPAGCVVCGNEVVQALRIVFMPHQVADVPLAAGHHGLHDGCRCDDVSVFVSGSVA